MIEYKIEDHASSFLPEHKKWKLVWSDEFDGDKLDESKWGFREYFWGKKSPTFTREGVYVDGESNLHMAMVKKATITFRLSFRPERWFMICPRTVRAFGRSVNLKSRNLCTNSDITNVGVSSRKITAGMPHSGFRLPE